MDDAIVALSAHSSGRGSSLWALRFKGEILCRGRSDARLQYVSSPSTIRADTRTYDAIGRNRRGQSSSASVSELPLNRIRVLVTKNRGT